MSMNYRFKKPVPFEKIRNHGLEGVGVIIGPDEYSFYLTDGTNYLHVGTEDGSDVHLVRYGANDVGKILKCLSKFGEVIGDE